MRKRIYLHQNSTSTQSFPYFRDRNHFKGSGGALTTIWWHLPTIVSGSVLMLLHMIFKPLIESIYNDTSRGDVENVLKNIIMYILTPYKRQYDITNKFGFYITAMYGVDFGHAMKRSSKLVEIGDRYMASLIGDSFAYLCILLVSSSTLCFGLALNNSDMRRWRNMVLLFMTGLWVSISFLMTFKHINEAFYMCVCMDFEEHGRRKSQYKFPVQYSEYLKKKEKFGLRGSLKFSKPNAKSGPEK